MKKNEKLIFCYNCNKDITAKNHQVKFVNIYFETKFFCSKKCKNEWISNLQENKEIFDENYSIRKAKQKALEIKTLYNELGPKYSRNGGRWAEQNPNNTQVSLHVPSREIDIIEMLVLFGSYQNKSEAIRQYINNGIKQDLKEFQIFENLLEFDIEKLKLIIASKKHQKSNLLNDFENIIVKDNDGTTHEYRIIKVLDEVN